jgi:hypothetical protein
MEMDISYLRFFAYSGRDNTETAAMEGLFLPMCVPNAVNAT